MFLLHIFFIAFLNKAGSQPIDFAPRAQAQRTQWNIPTDSLDYSVSPRYLDSIQAAGATILHTSRWMNGATVSMTDAQAQTIATKPFVRFVEKTRRDTLTPAAAPQRQTEVQFGTPSPDLATYNLLPLHQAGYYGQGIQIAVCDGAFLHADSINGIDTGRCLGAYKLSDEPESIYQQKDGNHGTRCLSFIAANRPDFCGAAPLSDYYLFWTEETYQESRKEMDNWIVALEKADSLGINVISTSLGYYAFDDSTTNLSYAQLDGRTLRASQAATIAARKGMLLVIAMGNEGNKKWYHLDAPADADSILAVGAVGADSIIAPFSSHGPAADGRTKPDVCAVGKAAYHLDPYSQLIQGNGTSFATPLLAGMAAALWSAHPQETAMQIRERIIRSANRYNTPDNDYGFGIPNAWAAHLEQTATDLNTTFHSLPENGIIYTLDGQRINHRPHQLPYIQNGKINFSTK